MSENNYILTANQISKSYPMGATRLEVLKGLDFYVEPGEFVSIIGASGSGKSTLLHLLGALDRPDTGQVKFEDVDVSGLNSRDLNRFRNKMVGFVFQFYHLLDELTVLENVLLPAMASAGTISWLRCKARARQRAMELLATLGLDQRLTHKPYQLSGGERQRVALARALMNEPKIVLADEPTGNLDSETGNGILKVLGDLHQAGQTIVMVTHDDKIACRAQRIVRLTDGKVAENNSGQVGSE